MVLPPEIVHPAGEVEIPQKRALSTAVEVETYAGKIHVEWDPTAAVTPIGQLAFFIEFLKLGHRFGQWVDDCPLAYASNNAPKKIDVLGSLFPSILSGHNRYTHLTALRGDTVNTKLPGLRQLLQRLPATCQPAFIRGDCDWGNDPVMTELEEMGQDYLFEVKRSKGVKALIGKFEYSVLVTSLPDELVTLMRHYRDRADCENNFDEIKNQWGWGGFVTRQLQTSQIMARTVALIRRAYTRVHEFFSWLKATAPQLKPAGVLATDRDQVDGGLHGAGSIRGAGTGHLTTVGKKTSPADMLTIVVWQG